MQVSYLGKVAPALFFGMVLAVGCARPPATPTDVTIAGPDPDATPVADTAPVAVEETPVETNTVEIVETAQNIRYFVDNNNLAIRGTDPVAYFTQGGPVAGSADFTHTWNNAVWQFATAENRDLFAANPEQYAPQYGGFCAWAVSQGYTASIDPNAWKIVDGKLYLNYSRGVQRRWERDIPGNISQANANWPGVLTDS
ncbi:MAG: YHS domain-containing (seleno)protein [Leptolyngbyaceae cyanobacterium]